MVTTLKITTAILFFVGANLIVPRVTNAAAKYNPATEHSSTMNRANSGNSIIIGGLTKSRAKRSQLSSIGYEPPNYGDPDSEHGSGTR